MFFKCYVPVDQLGSTSLMIKVELLFSPEQQNVYLLSYKNVDVQAVGVFQGQDSQTQPHIVVFTDFI